VELFHGTDNAGARGIEHIGFAVSHVGDSPGQSWLCSHRESVVTGSATLEYLVIVELPDLIAHQYQSEAGGEPYLDNYVVPWAVLNAHRPFRFEQSTGITEV
jgi:hypothetical protein